MDSCKVNPSCLNLKGGDHPEEEYCCVFFFYGVSLSISRWLYFDIPNPWILTYRTLEDVKMVLFWFRIRTSFLIWRNLLPMKPAMALVSLTNETSDFATLGDYPVRLWSKYVQLSPVIHTDHRKSYQAAGILVSSTNETSDFATLGDYPVRTMVQICPVISSYSHRSSEIIPGSWHSCFFHQWNQRFRNAWRLSRQTMVQICPVISSYSHRSSKIIPGSWHSCFFHQWNQRFRNAWRLSRQTMVQICPVISSYSHRSSKIIPGSWHSCFFHQWNQRFRNAWRLSRQTMVQICPVISSYSHRSSEIIPGRSPFLDAGNVSRNTHGDPSES